MIKLVLCFILSLIITIVLMPLFIKFVKKLSCSQTILKYVEEHKSKQGTPTLGGAMFFAVTIPLSLIFLKYQQTWFLCLMIGFAFAMLGGMDDFIKIKFKRNLGLLPYQKIIGQLGISLVLGLFVFYNVGTSINLPFFNTSLRLGWGIIPFVMLTCIACTNAVNLTDGLDGLAGNISAIVCGVTIAIFALLSKVSTDSYFLDNYYSLSVVLAIFMGSILGFLVYNTNKASIFMGDMGSLGIGGILSACYCVVGLELSLLIVGVMFVVSALSVILQVLSFKLFKKRIFKIAPLHHHFQQSGFSEAKITYCYSLTTLVLGLFLIISYL